MGVAGLGSVSRPNDVHVGQDRQPNQMLDAQPQRVAPALARWLSERHPDAREVQVSGLATPQGAGMSNVTVLFDWRWRDAVGEPHGMPCVARLAPVGGGKTLFARYDIAEQYRLLDALHGRLAVPAVLGLETDPTVLGAPFYLMHRLSGRVPPDMPPLHMDGWVRDEATPAERERLWWLGIEATRSVHRLDGIEASLGFLSPPAGRGALDARLDTLERYLRWAPEGWPHPDYERALQWLRDHRPADGRVGLCWGDARLANVLYAEDLQSVAAILDWEMACLGDPAQDLAWWLFVDAALSSGLGATRLDGFPSVADTLSEWRAQDAADGVDPLDDASFHYYWVAAAFYFGLIITRSMICRGSADPVADNFVTPLLRSALAE